MHSTAFLLDYAIDSIYPCKGMRSHVVELFSSDSRFVGHTTRCLYLAQVRPCAQSPAKLLAASCSPCPLPAPGAGLAEWPGSQLPHKPTPNQS